MSIFSDIKEGLKIVKAIKEVKEFLNSTHLTKEIKKDLETIKNAFDRLQEKVKVFSTIAEIIKKVLR